MKDLQADVTDPSGAVRLADEPEGLAGIAEPDCAAVVWRRAPKPGFKAWIDDLDPGVLPSARLILRPDAVANAVEQVCDIANLPEAAERDWLEADVADLARRFAAISGAPYLRLRLDVIASNACAKFHIDAITARLICSYRGSGTQYGISVDGDEPAKVFQVAGCAPFILRGTLWPEKPASGLRHRSPPIEGTGETRLLLVIDPIFDLEDAD